MPEVTWGVVGVVEEVGFSKKVPRKYTRCENGDKSIYMQL